MYNKGINTELQGNTGSLDMLKKTIEKYCWEAMEQLLKEKPYNKITVRDIAQRVGISTVTFYKHFKPHL